MTKKDLLPRPSDPERETVGQVMRDLGVDVIHPQKKTVTGVKWAQKGRIRKLEPALTFSKSSLYLNRAAAKMIRTPDLRYRVGVGMYDGKTVVLIHPDAEGYRIAPRKGKGAVITTGKGLIGFLHDQGLKIGKYDLVGIKGGWMGVPVE